MSEHLYNEDREFWDKVKKSEAVLDGLFNEAYTPPAPEPTIIEIPAEWRSRMICPGLAITANNKRVIVRFTDEPPDQPAAV